MTSEYSISVNDWQDERWEQIGVDTMFEHYRNSRKMKKEAKNYDMEIEDYAQEKSNEHSPMMLYAYPLHHEPSEKEIIDVCTKTNCTVVYNTETDDWFLALSSGGMDLSQDIAYAYLLTDGRIPASLAVNVSTQAGLSIDKKNFQKIMRAIKSELNYEIYYDKQRIKEINQSLKQLKEKSKVPAQ